MKAVLDLFAKRVGLYHAEQQLQMIERAMIGFLIQVRPGVEPARVRAVPRVRRIEGQVHGRENALREDELEPLRAEAARIEVTRREERRDAGSGNRRRQIIELVFLNQSEAPALLGRRRRDYRCGGRSLRGLCGQVGR